MSEEKLRIVFMGTPEFAVASLNALVEAQLNVVAVITAPDKPKGRGQKVYPSPVKEAAVQHNLPVLQPTNLKSPEFVEELRSLNADLQVIVAFRMLPEVVWSMPSKGTFNLHASLLPQYRGAAPINWAIINGEKETGVTTFFLKHEIDTGSIILQEKEPISEEDNVGTVYSRLMQRGAGLVVKTVQLIQKQGELKLLDQPQSEEGLKMAPKIFKEDCKINWSADAKDIINLIRGLSPYPAAWTIFNDKQYKIFEVRPSQRKLNLNAGELETDNKTYISVQTGNGALDLIDFQQQGKKRMVVGDFLRGNTV